MSQETTPEPETGTTLATAVLQAHGYAPSAASNQRPATMKMVLVVGVLSALGALGGSQVVSGVHHAVVGQTCTLRWIGSDAYIVMNGPTADEDCQTARGLSSDLALVETAPSFPTVCRYSLTGTTQVTVRDSGDDTAGADLCAGQARQ
jgi:hypothetical protein